MKPATTTDRLLLYFLLGIGFGIVLTKAEVISWFRIQEMFRFHSFHMYGIIGSAVLVSAVGIALIRLASVSALNGEVIVIPPKAMGLGYRYGIGGTLFGLGWALTGACPGPLFALIGSGVGVMAVAVLSAVAGTWVYGLLRPRLPH
ncbi:MAG: YeeE/YedE family protein [candidate division Zixibacteria bacterium]|nr:YeeE/YedE family protein [candidate division Zixibacteria bacterium]